MTNILFNCSGCASPLSVDTNYVGQVLECPGCNQNVLVPEVGRTFQCSHCLAELAAPAGMAGEVTGCPECGATLSIPKSTRGPIHIKRQIPEPSQKNFQTQSRQCPYCGKNISSDDVFCVHCGTDLKTGKKQGMGKRAQPSSEMSTSAIIGIILAVLFVVGIGVSIWSQPASDDQYPSGQSYPTPQGSSVVTEQQRQTPEPPRIEQEKKHPIRNEVEQQAPSVQSKADAVAEYRLRRKDTQPKDMVMYVKNCAELGVPDAQFDLAVMLTNGRGGLTKDAITSVEWLRKAANQGFVEAQISLGFMLYEGSDVPRNVAEAVTWFQKAADAGSSKGALNLGLIFDSGGLGIPQDWKQAASWFRKAADNGNAQAQRCLSNLYREGRGLSQNPLEAAKWCLRAAESGDAYAQFNMGVHFETGLGVAKDWTKALKWYRSAAAQGNQDALKTLAGLKMEEPINNEERDPTNRALLQKGLDLQERGDATQANIYFRQAAERGSAWGQNNLGINYMQGSGVQKNSTEGARLMAMAAAQGLREAQAALGSCYLEGTGVQKNLAECARWYRMAAEQGDAVAQRQLCIMYAGGIGVPKSNTEAVRWAREAASRGDSQAKEWISKWDAMHNNRHPTTTGY